jgi:hypothetical protein
MHDRAATHQIRYRPTTSKSGPGSREFRAYSSQKRPIIVKFYTLVEFIETHILVI